MFHLSLLDPPHRNSINSPCCHCPLTFSSPSLVSTISTTKFKPSEIIITISKTTLIYQTKNANKKKWDYLNTRAFNWFIGWWNASTPLEWPFSLSLQKISTNVLKNKENTIFLSIIICLMSLTPPIRIQFASKLEPWH